MRDDVEITNPLILRKSTSDPYFETSLERKYARSIVATLGTIRATLGIVNCMKEGKIHFAKFGR